MRKEDVFARVWRTCKPHIFWWNGTWTWVPSPKSSKSAKRNKQAAEFVEYLNSRSTHNGTIT